MKELLHPGVYTQVVNPLGGAIEVASTAIAAFVGITEKGPLNKAIQIKNFTQYQQIFGWNNEGFHKDSYLGYCVKGFFDNGGRKCYVVRVTNAGPVDGTKKPTVATMVLKDKTSAYGIVVSSSNETPLKIYAGKLWKDEHGTDKYGEEGVWGKDIRIKIVDGTTNPDKEFNLYVLRGDNVVETIEDLSVVEGMDNYYIDVINKTSRYVCASLPNGRTTVKSAGFLVSGNTTGSIVTNNPDNIDEVFMIKVDDSKFIEISINVNITNNLTDIAALIQKTVRDKSVDYSGSLYNAVMAFTCTYNANRLVLTSGNYSPTGTTTGYISSSVVISQYRAKSGDDAETKKEAASKKLLKDLKLTYDDKMMQASRIFAPSIGTYPDNSITVTGGQDPDYSSIQSSDYNKALHSLDIIQDVSIVSIPGNGERPSDRISNQDTVSSIISAGISYCSNRVQAECIFLADPPKSAKSSDMVEFVDKIPTKNEHGALYFPWLQVADPVGSGRNPTILVPPAGHMAGVYAANDSRTGVWQAPAGTDANILNIFGLALDLKDEDQDDLNPKSINAIRSFTGPGIVVWGARTLSNEIAWRYVPVARMASFLRVSIFNGIQYAVFKPNDEPLWASLRLNIGSFMLNLFKQGAFQGKTPSEAFFVKCDSETNPQDNIDKGIVTMIIGFAPLKPAEFVVVKITQKVGQAIG